MGKSSKVYPVSKITSIKHETPPVVVSHQLMHGCFAACLTLTQVFKAVSCSALVTVRGRVQQDDQDMDLMLEKSELKSLAL